MREIKIDAAGLMSKLNVQPGDLYVLKTPAGLTEEERAPFQELAQKFTEAKATLIGLAPGVSIEQARNELMEWLKTEHCSLHADQKGFRVRHPQYGRIAQSSPNWETAVAIAMARVGSKG